MKYSLLASNMLFFLNSKRIDDDDDDDDDDDKDDDKDDDDHLTVQSWQESACSSFTQWSTKPFPVLNTLTNHPILKLLKII